MNKLARKLVLSVLTVVLTVVALGTTTFAWFTLTNTSVIQPFQAQVVSDTGIEVAIGSTSADPLTLTWKSVITTQDIYNYIESVYGVDAFRFTHVSTVDGRNFTGVDGLGVVNGYLEIPLHFRSNNEQIIKWKAVNLSSTPALFRTGVQFVDSQGVTRLANSQFNTNLQDAMKISVTGIVVRATNTIGTTAYENPVSETNTLSGGMTNIDLRGVQEEVLVGGTLQDLYVGVNGAQNYYFRQTMTLPAGSGTVTTVPTVTVVNPDADITVLEMSAGNIVTAEAEYYGNIMVRVWFDGWDREGYNGLLGRMITIGLTFGV
ncbi:MAG: hypothetical protein Q7I99_03140 [Acholeplasmataceae bacterium]|nr:hypothetical protein [Acholeplasmataceae bacterium]